MNGIFGGFLGIIDSIGGGFLYILIGEAASKASTAVRLVRLLFGALLFGTIVSVIIYVMSPEQALQKMTFQNNSLLNDFALPIIYILPAAALALTALLKLLRFGIDRKSEKPEIHELRITPADRTERTERELPKRAA